VFLWFLGHVNKIRVRVCEEKRERRRRREEERERFWKNEGERVWNPFIYVLGSGWPKPDPLSPIPGRLIKILMDLDQSNAPGALVWSGSIRSVGLGFLPAGFWFSFNFLSFSCYVHPCVCYLDLLCVLTSSQNSKKLLCVLDIFVTVLWYFTCENWWKFGKC